MAPPTTFSSSSSSASSVSSLMTSRNSTPSGSLSLGNPVGVTKDTIEIYLPEDGYESKENVEIAPIDKESASEKSSSWWNYFLECCLNIPLFGSVISCLCGYSSKSNEVEIQTDLTLDITLSPEKRDYELGRKILQLFSKKIEKSELEVIATSFGQIQTEFVKLELLERLHPLHPLNLSSAKPEQRLHCSREDLIHLFQNLGDTRNLENFINLVKTKHNETSEAGLLLKQTPDAPAVYEGLARYVQELRKNEDTTTKKLIINWFNGAEVPRKEQIGEAVKDFAKIRDLKTQLETICELRGTSNMTATVLMQFMDTVPGIENFYNRVHAKAVENYLEENRRYTRALIDSINTGGSRPAAPYKPEEGNEQETVRRNLANNPTMIWGTPDRSEEGTFMEFARNALQTREEMSQKYSQDTSTS